MRVDDLNGRLVSAGSGPPVFDDVNSYVVDIQSARVSLTADSLTNLMNNYVFAGPDAPLRKLKIEIEGHADAVALGAVARRGIGAVGHVVVGADRLQHAQAVVPDEDAGTEGAQLAVDLVDAGRPAALAQRDGGDQAGETRAGDLGMHHSAAARLLSLSRPSSCTRSWV